MTHAIHWLPSVDSIVVMHHGRISEIGSYQDLLSHDKAFAQFLKTYLTRDDDSDETDEESKQFLIVLGKTYDVSVTAKLSVMQCLLCFHLFFLSNRSQLSTDNRKKSV